MSVASYYSQEAHGPFFTKPLGNFELESGVTLRNATIAYSTFGTLSPAKDNAILFPSWYSGTSKIIEQAYIGQGRALDPDKYFIVVANQLGNGLSSSPHNMPSPLNGASFPEVMIGDDVRAQHQLLTEHLGIEELQLVLGGSMGAQQTYEWAVRFPKMVKRAAPIAGTAKGTAHNQLLVQTFREAITSDPRWDEGCYSDAAAVQRGLRRHARVFAASGFSPRLFSEEGWRAIGFSSTEDFLTNFVEGYFLPMDPNNLLLMLNKWAKGDVTRGAGGTLQSVLSKITARVTTIAIQEDGFFPLADIQAEQKMTPNSELVTISSPWGHLALFGIDPEYNSKIDATLKRLLLA
ncbi:homoserine O-acetyltransferase [Panacagrimonas perspica]|uniref:Homoserine O-acetyltransferase n=1 Tax=Panacagrimonas perspica TaxID=381431 RepID=A0A4R7NYT4_9GAMM|nr:homoserine O-acetyltransferase [Panacagrimonas perspica]THD02115.1 hypothetical protein B1810_16720 [Panacagrimonas perspica]